MADATTSTAQAAPMTRALRLFYGFGSVSFGVKDNGFSYMLFLYYNQVVGLAAPLVGLALFAALVVDAFVDPLIGQISDNVRTPLGRRHPFMYAAALPVAVSYLALWNPPHWGQQGLFLYLVITAIVIRVFISFYEVPSSALSAELSTNYDERTTLLSYRYFFGWVGGLTMNYLAFAVLLTPDATHKYGQLNPAGYSKYGLIASFVMFFAILISAAGTQRRASKLNIPPKRRLPLGQALREMRETLSNRSFAFLLISAIFGAMASGLVTTLNGYFNTFFWEFSARQISYFTAGVYLSAIIALNAAPLLGRRFGKRPVAMAGTALSVAVGVGPLLLRLAGLMPPNHSQALVGIIFFTSVISVALGVTASIAGSSMIADVVEDSQLKTGRRSEGLFFAASAFIGKAVSGFGIVGASIVVQLIHLNPSSDPSTTPPSVVSHLGELYCPLIIGLQAVAILLLLGYRITRRSHEETLAQLTAEAELSREAVA
ncbi:MAG TPA: MFS transporter [Caulobacteraceae bacterium]|nr:MFS transporter [Caulobacteraceae bacterium]